MGDTTERIPEMHEDLFLMYSISRMGVAFECWEPKKLLEMYAGWLPQEAINEYLSGAIKAARRYLDGLEMAMSEGSQETER